MYTKNFKELNKNDAAIAGGKGASLGEMINSGISVPPGFVVVAGAFGKFLEETDLNVEIESILSTVDIQKMHTVEKASEKIQGLILEAKMSEGIKSEIEKEFKKLNAEYVAVRSSATAEDGAEHAWAGQLNSYLNTTQENLLTNIQKCWASLFTPRAIFYRFEKGLHDTHISVAVVVQKMIQSEKSGIAFSVHPVTQDYNQLIIEAGFGLGEAIVSGSITPDSYVVEKDSKNILDININTQTRGLYSKGSCHPAQSPSLDDMGRSGGISGNEWRELGEKGKEQVLSEKEILELSNLIIKIEDHYNFPCDIEWAWEGGKFYITQSRPITTLNNISKKEIDVLKHIKDVNFSKQITYSFIPVICFESAMRSYINNPLQERLQINDFPKVIEILTDKFEGWDDQNIQRITDAEDIKFVIQESRLSMKTHEAAVNNLLKTDYLKLSDDEFVKLLKSLDNICMEVYQRYIYFIHEFFDTNDSELTKLLPKVRIELSDFVSNIYICCDRMIEALAERFKGIKWQTFTYATFDEIINLLEDTKKIEEFKKIYDRPIAFVYDGKNISAIKEEESIKEIINFLNNQEKIIIGDCEEFEGKGVSKGYAKGVVAKISECDYGKVNSLLEDKNDYILVTPMTRPDFVPYLKKAKAIITDEGGITCHAAIVARELNIPCIVGTKIATQVLKDGDLVEVDADRGVVRILGKSK